MSDDERREINERLHDELEELRSEVARLKRGEFTPEEFQALCHHRDETPGCTRAAFEHGCIAYQVKLFGPPREFTDIVFENPPSAEAHARFVEVENAQGQSIEFGEWLQRTDGMWVLRIPYMAEDVNLDKLFKAKPTKGGMALCGRETERPAATFMGTEVRRGNLAGTSPRRVHLSSGTRERRHSAVQAAA